MPTRPAKTIRKNETPSSARTRSSKAARTKEASKAARAKEASVLHVHQDRSRETRDLFLKAGERIFGHYGYEAAHIRDIAEEAGCSVGAFYGRFKDKRALFDALEYQIVSQMKSGVVSFFESEKSSRSVEDTIRNFLKGSQKVFLRHHGFYRAQLELLLQGVEEREPWRELEKIITQQWYDFLLNRGVRIPGPDPLFSVGVGIRVINNYILRRTMNPRQGRLEPRFFAELTRNLMVCWGLPAKAK